MRIFKIFNKARFEPITFQVTVESQEELDALLSILPRGFKIPESTVVESPRKEKFVGAYSN